MSSNKKKTPAEELLDSLLSEVGDDAATSFSSVVNMNSTVVTKPPVKDLSGDATLVAPRPHQEQSGSQIRSARTEIRPAQSIEEFKFEDKTEIRLETFAGFENVDSDGHEATSAASAPGEDADDTEFGHLELDFSQDNVIALDDFKLQPDNERTVIQKRADDPTEILKSSPVEMLQAELEIPVAAPSAIASTAPVSIFDSLPIESPVPQAEVPRGLSAGHSQASSTFGDKTEVIASVESPRSPTNNNKFNFNLSDDEQSSEPSSRSPAAAADSERTLAVTGFHVKPEEDLEDKVKVSVGTPSRSGGFASWGGGVDSNLSQAENLRMAQEKILELENENERTRRQNEELIAATEILKERSDLLTAQLTEYKNDRDGLEQSFKNELTLLRNHLARKDSELKKSQFKVDELESRLKFDLKKIRVRERELENRLELVRAEKNAISKNKDEQILDLRRKMDVIQMEVDSYRQKCVELNKQIENSQDSFKRTTRALRLAMANLELQDENKVPLKKAE